MNHDKDSGAVNISTNKITTMGRKKALCSVNATLQADGRVYYTFRHDGEEIGISQLPLGHASKLYRSLGEVRNLLKKGFPLDYIDRQQQIEERKMVANVVRNVLNRYPNTPQLNRIRIEIDDELNKKQQS